MPIYEYQCGNCKRRFEAWALMGNRHDPQECKCGGEARFVISAPRVFGDFEPYESPASGKWIEGRAARREDFARTGTRPYEDGERVYAARVQREQEAQVEAQIDHAVEQTMNDLTL